MSCAKLLVIFITVPVVFLIGLTALMGVEKGSMDPSNIALAIIVPIILIVFFGAVVLGMTAASNRRNENTYKELLRATGVREGSVEWKVMVADYEQTHRQ